MAIRTWAPIIRALLAAASIGAVGATASAQTSQAATFSARQMVDICLEGYDARDGQFSPECVFYFTGQTSGIAVSAAMLSRPRGLLAGTDMLTIVENMMELTVGCPPTGVTLDQHIRAFIIWVVLHPEQQGQEATLAFAAGSQVAWPCE